MKAIETGCDVLLRESCRSIAGESVGVLCNPASVTVSFRHILDALLDCGVHVARIFGPQHGLFGDTQANMIEWEGFMHPRLGVPVHSLYGERREPSTEMLEGIDAIVIDLPDVGARPYTYLWTSFLVLRAAARAHIAVVVLDRPNPLSGTAVEGPLLGRDFRSFVGLAPLPMRHGLTIGEALGMMNDREALGCELRIIRMNGWRRAMLFADTGLPWILPSPNMPTAETALVYPGTVMLEGTNISEGRGTARPFHIVGAPWIDPDAYAETLAGFEIPGAAFRPLRFVPSWDKYEGVLCGGVEIHVINAGRFTPVRCGAAVIAGARRLSPERFAWKEPPYEYELRLPPIDIISGNAHLRETIDAGRDLSVLFGSWELDEARFLNDRSPYLLYE
jgi:uncharacterized protein YbbC (DUF1343 family)